MTVIVLYIHLHLNTKNIYQEIHSNIYQLYITIDIQLKINKNKFLTSDIKILQLRNVYKISS